MVTVLGSRRSSRHEFMGVHNIYIYIYLTKHHPSHKMTRMTRDPKTVRMEGSDFDYRQSFQELRHSVWEAIAKDKEVGNLKISSHDRIHFANFLNSPVSEDFYAALFKYFNYRFADSVQNDDRGVLNSWSLKLGNGKFSPHFKTEASDEETNKNLKLVSAAYRSVLSFGSNIRLLSRDRVFFELFYKFSKVICARFNQNIPPSKVEPGPKSC